MNFFFRWFGSKPTTNDVDEDDDMDSFDKQVVPEELEDLNNIPILDDNQMNEPNDTNETNDDSKHEGNSGSNEETKEDHDSELSDDDDEELLGGPFETLEEEIQFLRSHNEKLRKKVKYHKSKRKLFDKNDVVQMRINGQIMNVKRPKNGMTLDELSTKVQERLPKFLQQADQSTRNDTIYIPSDVENEIGIIDIKTVDWWDMVDLDKVHKDDALSTFNNDSTLQYESTEALGGPYIVLRESDVIDAIACFVAQCVMSIPECRNLDHEEMMTMIDGTFSELKEKGPLGKMLDWSSFVYSTYGWTTFGYTVYTNAAVAKTVLSCFVSAAFFIGVL